MSGSDIEEDKILNDVMLNDIIAPDKRRWMDNILLISPQKYMLWYSLEAPR